MAKTHEQVISQGDVLDLFRVRFRDPSTVLHVQITQQVRDVIRSGVLCPGSQLPSLRALAEEWDADAMTVRQALIALEKEGLLIIRHGKGTFVQKREERLTSVGIYLHEDFLGKHSSDFLRAIHSALKDELDRLGIRTQIWVDPRPENEQTTPWRELCRAAEQREIQGLIVPAISCQMPWLNKLPIPSASVTWSNVSNSVKTNLGQMADLGLRCLANQGCRSVGYIGMANLSSCPEGSGSSPFVEFFERFTDLAGDLGLAMKNEWIRIPSSDVSVQGNMPQEQFGYEEVLKFMNLADKPDGLFVFPDTTARGVILGLREKQVRVPESLKLVLHQNESTPLLCPMPASLVVHSERAYARALIEQVQKQFRGEPCEPIIIGFTMSSTENANKP